MAEKVKVRYLGGDHPTHGSWGYEHFKIDGDTAEVSPEVAQAMVLEQPSLWSEHKNEDARKVEAANRKTIERVEENIKEASASVAEQVPNSVRLAASASAAAKAAKASASASANANAARAEKVEGVADGSR